MKTTLVILMLLHLALPGAVWACLMTEPVCTRVELDVSHCACCQPGSCVCAQPADSVPASHTPAFPARSDFAHGFAVVPDPDENRALLLAPPHSKRLLRASQAAGALRHGTVPLHIWHCSPLW